MFIWQLPHIASKKGQMKEKKGKLFCNSALRETRGNDHDS